MTPNNNLGTMMIHANVNDAITNGDHYYRVPRTGIYQVMFITNGIGHVQYVQGPTMPGDFDITPQEDPVKIMSEFVRGFSSARA